MNIADAKEIRIELLAEKLGAKFAHTRLGYERWYYSPFRDEKTPSFKIDTRTNTFKDWGHHLSGGDVIDLYCDYNNLPRKQSESVKEALKALEDFAGISTKFIATKEAIVTYSDVYKILSRSDKIIDKGLKEELHRRKIPAKMAQDYINQAFVQNTNSGYKFNAIAMDNDAGGVELSVYDPKKKDPKFKNCIGAKAITTFPADGDAENIAAYAYSSMWDFLTWVNMKGRDPKSEYIVYHGDSLNAACAEYILGKPEIKRVFHFKHLDHSGEMADANLSLLLEGLEYGTMESLYAGHKDLCEAIMQNGRPYQPTVANSYQENKPKPNQNPSA